MKNLLLFVTLGALATSLALNARLAGVWSERKAAPTPEQLGLRPDQIDRIEGC